MIPGGRNLLLLAALFAGVIWAVEQPELPLPPLADLEHHEADMKDGWSTRGTYRGNLAATTRAFRKTFERAGLRGETISRKPLLIMRWTTDDEPARSWLLSLSDHPTQNATVFLLGEEP